MAAPITHIVLAKELLDSHPSIFSERDFFIGTSFPDIRHLHVIERNKTHNPETTLKKVLENKNSFHSGLLFHSLVDEMREKFIQKSNTYSLAPKSKCITQALKSVEDEILFHRIEDWRKIIMYTDSVLEEETTFSIDRKDIEKWHALLKDYFSDRPSKDTRKKFFVAIGFGEQDIEEIESTITLVKKNEKIVEILKGVYYNFNNLLRL